MKINKCIECKKIIDKRAKRCKTCHNRYVAKNFLRGIHIDAAIRAKISETIKKLFLNPKNNPNYLDGRTLKKHYCIDCGEEVSSYQTTRCYTCFKKSIIREGNSNFIHGKGYEPYTTFFSKQLKLQIRKRDNYTCQCCNIQEKNYFRKLDIHHIDYDKQNCNENNLISLCQKCNLKANTNRDYWFAYFTYKMESK